MPPAHPLLRFLDHDVFAGIFLMISAFAALVVANTSLSPFYDDFLSARLAVTLAGEGLEKPLILWINDGLMAVFFLMVGLELKREILEGKLKNPRDVVLPGMAAVGGMAMPALIFVAVNWGNPVTLGGWAIPAATDIAFALGVLAMAGKGVPPSLKVFLLTLAILDDLGAILIIAFFYTSTVEVGYLLAALVPLAILAGMNRFGAHRIAPLILVGVVLWFLMLKSGVHATLAGVATAFFIPLRDRFGKSPLHALEHALQPYVNYLILPVFAFANAGVSLAGLSLGNLLDPLPLGIAGGLFFGKMIGVFGLAWIMVRLGLARMPAHATWVQVFGVACLAGIGFTMSLFIGSLSFDDPLLMNEVRVGVLSGSLLSGVLGYLVLTRSRAPVAQAAAQGT